MQRKMTVSEKQGYSIWFIFVVLIFTTCLLTANVISVKLVTILGFIMPAGTVIFPLSYIVGDVLTEVYGYSQARRVIWLGFICNVLMVIAILVAQTLPSPEFWDGQKAFERILGYTPRLLIASFAAYLVGEFANSYVLARMKVMTSGKLLWTRLIGSTAVGQGLDSLVFIAIAFAGSMPEAVLISTIITQWVAKTGYEVVVTPLTYVVVNFLKKKEGADTYDRDSNFSPFSLTE